MTHVSKSWIFE